MPPVVIAAGIAVAGAAVSASASQNAANAQNQAATSALQQQSLQRQAAYQAAQPSFGQMQAIQNQYQMSSNLLDTQLSQLSSQYSLYQAASSQAKALMSGQAASSLAPMQQQQQLQRQQLQQSLARQYGPGYASSTAGSMALANFDMQSQYATSQAQQSATSLYLGASETLGANYTQGLNSAYATAGNLNMAGVEAGNQLQSLKVSALNGSQPNYAPSIQTAGNGSVGWGQFGSSVTGIAGAAAGYAAGSGSPTPNPTAGSYNAVGNGTMTSNNLWSGGGSSNYPSGATA